MSDSRHQEHLSAVVALAAAAVVVAQVVLAQMLHVRVLAASAPFTLMTVIAASATWLRVFAARRAREGVEQSARPTDTTIFVAEDENPWIQHRQLIEKLVVYGMAPLMCAVQGVGAYLLMRWLGAAIAEPVGLYRAAAFLAATTFGLFTVGRYLLGLSRDADCRPLTAPATYCSLAAMVTAVSAVAVLLSADLYPAADRLAGWILAGVLVLLAAESAVHAVGQIYRPRSVPMHLVTGESLLVRLMVDPASWASTLAQTLDYQFGFGVSHSWFYQIMIRACLPFVAVVLLTLYGLSCFVFLGPDEQGVLERWGVPAANRACLDSGVHLKWPWPVETVRRFPVKRVQSFVIGYQAEPDEAQPTILLWTVPHYKHEYYFVTAGRDEAATNEAVQARQAIPASLLTVNLPIEYLITNITQYAYTYADPAQVLQSIVMRAVTKQAAGSDISRLMGANQLAAAETIRQTIQSHADAARIGVKIVFVGVHGMHPPVAVAPAFESVVGALETREAVIQEARSYEAKTLPKAEADAAARVLAAEAKSGRRAALARAEADLFVSRLKAYTVAPDVYKPRILMGTLRDAIKSARKYIVTVSPEREVVTLNLEEKLKPELFDLSPAPKEEKTQ